MSEANMLVPLEISLIDEGRFERNINKALMSLQEQLIKHVKLHGHKAAKAKAKLTAEVTLVCLDTEQQSYGCVAQIKTTLPSAPPAASLLMSGETQTNEPCLLCRKSGSTKDSPAQMVLSTLDGKTVDTETGEVEDTDQD